MRGLNVMMVMQVRGHVFHVGRYSMTERGLSQGEKKVCCGFCYNAVYKQLYGLQRLIQHNGWLRKAGSLQNEQREKYG
jgi:hypothetical protein